MVMGGLLTRMTLIPDVVCTDFPFYFVQIRASGS